jgi:tRNA(Ile2) C34 agmatinyltransferase TiaS
MMNTKHPPSKVNPSRNRLLTFIIYACFSLGAIVTIVGAKLVGSQRRTLRSFLRAQGLGDTMVGAIGGIVIGAVLVGVFAIVSFTPLFVTFYFLGPKCHSCGKPLIGPGVGKSGRCWRCGARMISN